MGDRKSNPHIQIPRVCHKDESFSWNSWAVIHLYKIKNFIIEPQSWNSFKSFCNALEKKYTLLFSHWNRSCRRKINKCRWTVDIWQMDSLKSSEFLVTVDIQKRFDLVNHLGFWTRYIVHHRQCGYGMIKTSQTSIHKLI